MNGLIKFALFCVGVAFATAFIIKAVVAHAAPLVAHAAPLVAP